MDTLAESPAVKLLFVGDVVGGIGRRALAAVLPGLRDLHQPDFVFVHGLPRRFGLRAGKRQRCPRCRVVEACQHLALADRHAFLDIDLDDLPGNL